MNWSIPGVHMQGASHRKFKVSCQDYLKVQIDSDDMAYVALCDGVSSATHAAKGAHFIANSTCEWLGQNKSEVFELSAAELSTQLIQYLLDQLRELSSSDTYRCDINEFAATLLFFVSDGQRYIAGNLGDGIFGKQDAQKQMHMLLEPEKGRFANESYFVTSANSHLHLRLIHGKYDPTCIYFLMTDGSAECVYDYGKQTFTRALSIYCDWCRSYSRNAVNKALFESMTKLFQTRTHDDCSLALVATDPTSKSLPPSHEA